MTGRHFINHLLDSLPQPTMQIRRRPHGSFFVCASTGLLCAVLLTLALVVLKGLSLLVFAVIVITWVFTMLTQAFATKIITGKEQFVCYRQTIALIAVTTILLWFLHQPVLAYLDVAIIFSGALISCGRVGCLLVGCCHGKPHTWGVVYRDAHADLGFPRYLVGVRLFPIQAVEAIWVMCIVVAGIYMVLRSNSPGAAFSACTLAYAGGRFCFEFMRGDANRPYLAGLSEAQWTSVILAVSTVIAEMVGVLPFTFWHAIAAVLLVITALLVLMTQSFYRQLSQPFHLKEIAETIEEISDHGGADEDGRVLVYRTSLGLLLSAGKARDESGEFAHYALSFENKKIDEASARIVAKLIRRFGQHNGPGELIARPTAVYHLLIR